MEKFIDQEKANNLAKVFFITEKKKKKFGSHKRTNSEVEMNLLTGKTTEAFELACCTSTSMNIFKGLLEV